MGRASVETLLPLDEFARILGISPWEFNQMVYPAKKSAQCSDVFFQEPWMKDHLSREEVAQAIADAEEMIANQLSFWPAPQYFTDEDVPYPHAWRPITGHPTPKLVKLKWNRIITGGVLKRTEIDTITGGDLVFTDSDGDNVKDLFTATITDPAIADITDPNEIALYFTETDRLGEPVDETWRIRPIKVTISGTTATIRGHLTLLVKPVLESGVAVTTLTATVDANYVDELVCYRVYTDATFDSTASEQGEAIWNTPQGCTAPNCTSTSRPLCLGNHNFRKGIASLSFARSCPAYKPTRLEVNYLAGLPLENGQMQPDLARAVTYLAVSLLAHEKCGCDRTNKIFDQWRKRITSFEEGDKTAAFSKEFNQIPFPATYGGVFAWKRVVEWRDSKSVVGLPA